MAKGIAKGDRVGIWAPNCAQWTLAQYACAKTGASGSTAIAVVSSRLDLVIQSSLRFIAGYPPSNAGNVTGSRNPVNMIGKLRREALRRRTDLGLSH